MAQVSTFIATGLAIKYRYSSLLILAEIYTIFFLPRGLIRLALAKKREKKRKKRKVKRQVDAQIERFQSFHQVHLRESLRGFSSSSNLADPGRPRLPHSGNRYSLRCYYVNRAM